MHVLFISEYYPPIIKGGGEINLSLIAQALADKGHKISVLTSYSKGLSKFEIKDNVYIHRRLKTAKEPQGIYNNLIRSQSFPKSIIKQVKFLTKKVPVDVIHFIGSSIIAAKELSQLKIPLFATVESYLSLCPKGDRISRGRKECETRCSLSKFLKCQLHSTEIGKTKNKLFLKYNPLALPYIYNYYFKLNQSLKYCKLIAISKYVQSLLLQQGHQSQVIPNLIKVEDFKVKRTEKLNKPKIIYLGALIESKGPQILIEALKGLNCRCELYGNGILKEQIQNTIKEYNLDAEIIPHVPYNQIPQVYANSDLVVFPSTWPEPFGRIAIEAMAAGKPVIGSAIGGIKETITTGILVTPGSVSELRDALIKLINNSQEREIIRKRGLKEVGKYSENTITKELGDLYEKRNQI